MRALIGLKFYENIKLPNNQITIRDAAMRHFPAGAATPSRGAATRLLDRNADLVAPLRHADPTAPSADALVQSFNSWAFKREQPDNPERLKQLARAAIE